MATARSRESTAVGLADQTNEPFGPALLKATRRFTVRRPRDEGEPDAAGLAYASLIGTLKGCSRPADSWLVDAGRRQEILVRYQARARQIEESAARYQYVPTAAEEATSRQRWAELALTKRELEVLELIADGHANQEIARELFVSEETVKSHMRNIFARLQARSRAHAVGIALRHGLIC